ISRSSITRSLLNTSRTTSTLALSPSSTPPRSRLLASRLGFEHGSSKSQLMRPHTSPSMLAPSDPPRLQYVSIVCAFPIQTSIQEILT
ncbi:hypothetical protein FRB94_004648, partial [Tulasnella sp. JGI-2019a]